MSNNKKRAVPAYLSPEGLAKYQRTVEAGIERYRARQANGRDANIVGRLAGDLKGPGSANPQAARPLSVLPQASQVGGYATMVPLQPPTGYWRGTLQAPQPMLLQAVQPMLSVSSADTSMLALPYPSLNAAWQAQAAWPMVFGYALPSGIANIAAAEDPVFYTRRDAARDEQDLMSVACAHARPAQQTRQAVGGLSLQFLQECYLHEKQWKETEAALVGCMKACGWCARVAFGGKHSMLHQDFRTVEVDPGTLPPAVKANPLVMAKGLAHVGGDTYHACKYCSQPSNRQNRAKFLPEVSEDDVKALHTIYQLDPALPLLLGVIICGVKLATRMKGFLVSEAAPDRTPLMDGPLISYAEESGYTAQEMSALLQKAVKQQRALGNPAIRKYLTVLEQKAGASLVPDGTEFDLASDAELASERDTDVVKPAVGSQADHAEASPGLIPATELGQTHAVPVLAGCVAEPIVERAQRRNTTAGTVQQTQERLGLAAVVHTGELMEQDEMAAGCGKRRNNLTYFAGEVQRRDAAKQRVFCTLAGLTAVPSLTVEYAIFSYLFPGGKGFFDGSIRLAEYMKLRSMQLFSPFTLVKEYLLVMIQVYLMHKVLSAVSESALESTLEDLRTKHPEDSDPQIYKKALKRLAPRSLPGTPGFHRKSLQDLLTYAAEDGMPHLFITCTADEVSEIRWSCINDLETFIDQKIMKGLEWQDVPVECARLFHDRFMHLLNDHILHPPHGRRGIFGRVKGHMVRYESQANGSLHAHMLLWLHPDDVETVCDEITASLPCCYEPVHMQDGHAVYQPLEPQDGSIVGRLTRRVLRKQKHTCNDGEFGCQDEHGKCKEGYPHKPNCQGTVFDDVRGMYKYFRMGPADSNIVPYHPLLLLLWNGGCNVQRVTNSSWSRYVLKYATKAEPSGHLNIDARSAAQLGIHGVSEHRLQFAAAAVMSKAISPSEATCLAAGIPIIQTSYDMTYADVSPPSTRRVHFDHGKGSLAPCDAILFFRRPAAYEELDFLAYFKHCIIVKNSECTGSGGKKRKPQFATDDPPLEDGLSNWVYVAKSPGWLVKLTDFHPVYQSEAFFYKLLLLSKPWRDEADFTPHDGSYFNECVRQGIITSMADVQKCFEDYADFHMHDTVLLEQQTALFMQQQDLSVLWGVARQPDAREDMTQDQVEAYHTLSEMMQYARGRDPEEASPAADQECNCGGVEDLDVHGAADLEAEVAAVAEALSKSSTACGNISLEALNAKQRAFVDAALGFVLRGQKAASDYVDPVVMFLRGGPGTGKTATLRVLLALLAKRAEGGQ